MKVGQVRRLGIVTRTCIAACLTGGLAMGMLAGTTVAASAHTAPLFGQAKKDLFVLSDMPSGWTSTKSSNNNSSFPGAVQLASCLGVPTSVIFDNPPSANSPDFDSKNHLQTVSDSVWIYPSVTAAQVDFASLADSKTPSCLTQVLNGSGRPALESQLGSGASVGNILVSRSRSRWPDRAERTPRRGAPAPGECMGSGSTSEHSQLVDLAHRNRHRHTIG